MLTNIVNDILNDYDLENLLDGTPECTDYEYAPEVKLISNFIENNKSKLNEDILTDNIQFAFINYFHKLHDISTCNSIAKDILEQMEFHKLI